MFSLGVSDNQDTDTRKKTKNFSVEYSSTGAVFFNWDFDWGNRSGSGSKLKVWITGEMKVISNFWTIWNVTKHEHGSRQIFETALSSTNGKCSMQTLVGGILAVVTEVYEFDYRSEPMKMNIS